MVRLPFDETQYNLVVAFDVGTTFSRVSYRYFEVRAQTVFPTQETGGASKIPTIIYYDPEGTVRAVGGEAARDETHEAAQKGKWVKAEWFKLHLQSKTEKSEVSVQEIPPFPLKKTAVQVFADFLRYLFDCTKNDVKDAQKVGQQFWDSLETRAVFVLSHPNAWEGPEQNKMRQAAVLAGLIPDNPAGQARLTFVTEGEASLHFAIQTNMGNILQIGKGVVLVDAGGGAINVSAYGRCDPGQLGPLAFEEIAASQCRFNGSVFVTINAKIFLKELLANCKFIDKLEHITQCFDKNTKLRFKNENNPQCIAFGSHSDFDWKYNIHLGQLKLSGSDVAAFFEPSVDYIVEAILSYQQKVSSHLISHVVLVGGFFANTWLVGKVRARLSDSGLCVLQPENNIFIPARDQIVSEGAVSFYLDHFVQSRMSRYAYGAYNHLLFNPSDPEHEKRSSTCFTSLSGKTILPGIFFLLISKHVKIPEGTEVRISCYVEGSPDQSFILLCYQGDIPKPVWIDEDKGNFFPVCTIIAPLPPNSIGNDLLDKSYYVRDFKVVLLFGLTELKAQTLWTENDVEKR